MDRQNREASERPPKPYGGGAAARLRQFEIERGLPVSAPEGEPIADSKDGKDSKDSNETSEVAEPTADELDEFNRQRD